MNTNRPRYSPKITVAAIVKHHQHFLMVEERVNNQLVLNQPAGHMEANESLVDAVYRETLEESGCKIEPMHLLSVYHSNIHDPDKARIRFNFAAKLISQNLHAKLDDGIIAVHWLSIGQIQQQQQRLRSPSVLSSLLDYQNGHQLPLSALHSAYT